MTITALLWRLNRSRRNSLAALLRNVSERFSSLGHSTEQDFLNVGQKLEEIVSRARSDSQTLAGLTSGLNIEREQSLAATLDEVTRWAHDASRGAGSGG